MAAVRKKRSEAALTSSIRHTDLRLQRAAHAVDGAVVAHAGPKAVREARRLGVAAGVLMHARREAVKRLAAHFEHALEVSGEEVAHPDAPRSNLGTRLVISTHKCKRDQRGQAITKVMAEVTTHAPEIARCSEILPTMS